MLGPGPGPAPTPSLTLPPLRELDKVLGPEADHGRISNPQPRSQSSDPHLHQHFQQQRPQGHSQYPQHSPSLASSQHGYKHHDPSSHFPSTGSLPGKAPFAHWTFILTPLPGGDGYSADSCRLLPNYR
ncbi:hypothetical protein BGZ68_002946 [Mortierella alpina]|nr:hypothetical protein BGZ68_002946 [Mortierella alpina]